MRPVHVDQMVRIQKQSLDIFQLGCGSRRIGGEDGGQFEEVEQDRFGDLGQVIGVSPSGDWFGEELEVPERGKRGGELEKGLC